MKKDFYIFLDMDGVLWTNGWAMFFYPIFVKSTPSHELDPRAVGLFDRLCTMLNPKVVMVSTWKHGSTVEELREELKGCGCKFHLHDKTEDIMSRAQEITDYVEKYNIAKEDYVVLDDESYDFAHSDRAVQTLQAEGFTAHEFKEILLKFGIYQESRRIFHEKRNKK